ncbi:class I SAM-dependent methyltransferase [Alkalinema pantanalense CENA528]|uniref:class I SAM-dependent methyltransferase n=1 Tax=Alkalinema pantanalense TaxID=1620705 RepID=UPI003D6F8568
MNLWDQASHALSYLERADTIPHRKDGEATLLEHLPPHLDRVLDLGTGNGRLLALVKATRSVSTATALDFSPTMLAAVRDRFADDPTVTVVQHNLDQPLPDCGQFDAIVSSFAIHHLSHDRKRSLYQEIFSQLKPGGIFCNLEHVASPSQRVHHQFLERLNILPENDDPSNQLLDMGTQLQWLREIGFIDVDCYWKWLELALLIGIKPDR